MGDAFEGGFYTGMIWNEVVQTSTSTIVGMGSKTFSVPDMTAAPLVYEGQTLEVRDRTTPTTKMVGTVSAAAGTSITINVTSVSGSGTLSDWSIMARYRLIVAPKATGQSASLAYKNADSAAPAACDSLTEGRKATLAMVAAGNSTVYPAAHFCNSLNIGGFTDWYLPARDELELCWRNLKPITSNNSTGTERPSLGYTNLGSLGDLVTNHGNNRNSSPVGASYSLSDPAQVAAGKNFRVGESEAFTAEARYWASTAVGGAAAAEVYFWTQFPGYQAAISKTRGNAVRAIRRSVI